MLTSAYPTLLLPVVISQFHGRLTFEHIRKLVTSTGYRNAKFAAQFLAFCEDKDEVCNEVIDVSPHLRRLALFELTLPIGNCRWSPGSHRGAASFIHSSSYSDDSIRSERF